MDAFSLEIRRRSCKVMAAVAFAFVFPVTVSADGTAQWFKNAPSGCAMIPAFSETMFNSLGISLLRESPGTGKTRYVQVQRSMLLPLQTSGFEIVQSKTLTPSEIDTLRAAIDKQGNTGKIPFVMGELGSMSVGYLLASVSGVAAIAGTMLWDHYVSVLNGRMDSLNTLRSLTTTGGSINYVMGLKYVSGSTNLLYASVEYHIQVGTESLPRNYAIGLCVYPYEVIVSKFETRATSGNKIVKRADGNKFTVWDVDSAKFSGDLTYEYQDQDYYYFRADPTTEYRISMWGGWWQKREGASGWDPLPLYPKVDSE
ncbi:hypothetical protein [Paraburkholderia sediminicola]|uniref:hypothetical protein n=1 Tax=Paraburkholderia sediminicola TaxID=458836 RepID=UPI0038B8BCC0